jgi:hypothetical protein
MHTVVMERGGRGGSGAWTSLLSRTIQRVREARRKLLLELCGCNCQMARAMSKGGDVVTVR